MFEEFVTAGWVDPGSSEAYCETRDVLYPLSVIAVAAASDTHIDLEDTPRRKPWFN